MKIEGGRGKGNVLSVYSDSDHAGDRPYTTRSHTGTMILLNNVPIHWASKKQTVSTAYSSAMAEVYALSETVRAARLIAWKCEDMNMNVSSPLVVQVDNDQARVFAHGHCLQSRLRGVVDMREDWVQELRDQNLVQVVHVNVPG